MRVLKKVSFIIEHPQKHVININASGILHGMERKFILEALMKLNMQMN